MPRRSNGDDLSSCAALLAALSLPAPDCVDAGIKLLHRSNTGALLSLLPRAAALHAHVAVIIECYRVSRELAPMEALLMPLLSSSSSCITSLDLSCTPLCFTDLTRATLSGMPHLIDLDLSDSGITPARLQDVAASARFLQRLAIARCRFLAPAYSAPVSSPGSSPGVVAADLDPLATGLMALAALPRLEALDARFPGLNLNHVRALGAVARPTLTVLRLPQALAATLTANASVESRLPPVQVLPTLDGPTLALHCAALRVTVGAASSRAELIETIAAVRDRRRFDSALAQRLCDSDERWAAVSIHVVALPRVAELKSAMATRTAAERALGVPPGAELAVSSPGVYVSLLSNLNHTPPRRLELEAGGKRSREAFETVIKAPPDLDCEQAAGSGSGSLLALRGAVRRVRPVLGSGVGALGSAEGALYTRRHMPSLLGQPHSTSTAAVTAPVCALQLLPTASTTSWPSSSSS